jgi:acetoin utilization deacetylase AcuC-like enzyme
MTRCRWCGRYATWPASGSRHIDGQLGFFAMDAGAPITATTWRAAKTSADLALTGLELLDQGQQAAFALCRPPGITPPASTWAVTAT